MRLFLCVEQAVLIDETIETGSLIEIWDMMQNISAIAERGQNRLLEHISQSNPKEKFFAKGEYILRQDQTVDFIYLVDMNLCTIESASNNGRVFSFGLFFCINQIFGEMEAFTGKSCQFSVKAYEDLTAKAIPISVFEKLVIEHNDIAIFLAKNLANNYQNATRNLIFQLLNPIQARIVYDIEQRELNLKPNRSFSIAVNESERFGCSDRVYRRAVKELLDAEVIKKLDGKLVINDYQQLKMMLHHTELTIDRIGK
ncbi:Crp/Fnr family transcriptional regulator [Vibrio taketomensis]|uniref:Crp/Fnr family transcriptional regulator n=1 Tax=Vibrio taketomensis TaxID=2572923 RepID=UPI00138A2323|nr:Crp/Fnr family transcriptional regulator [Vibrio taketomensis]